MTFWELIFRELTFWEVDILEVDISGVDILRLTRIKVEILKWLAVIGGSRWVVVWLNSSLARVLRRLGEYAGERILTEAQGGF